MTDLAVTPWGKVVYRLMAAAMGRQLGGEDKEHTKAMIGRVTAGLPVRSIALFAGLSMPAVDRLVALFNGHPLDAVRSR